MKEIALYILDIVYNSITAKANFIEIKILDSSKLNLIEIMIKDNGCGMNAFTVKKVCDPFYTTRITRNVGFGLPLFKEGVEATGGRFLLESKVDIGTVVTGTFVKDHLDRPPMGNLTDTLITLIQANAKIDYLFDYQSDTLNFSFNSKEIKAILDGYAINEPEVILWLKKYIKEGLTK